MKKTLLLALALIAVGPVTVEAQVVERVKCGLLDLIGVECAGTPKNTDDLVQQGDVWLDRETMRPYTGPVFELFSDDDSKVRSRTTLKDGRAHGIGEEYNRNGTLSSRMSFNNGELDGIQEIFNESGQSKLRIFWKDGEMSMPDGPIEQYYDNGQLAEKGTVVNGEQHGPWESYFNEGSLSSKGTYNMGTKCGQWLEGGGGPPNPVRTVTHPPC